MLLPRLERSPEQERALKEHFLAVAPELDSYNKESAALRQTLPAYVTTMVMRERLPEHARPAYRRHRGEYTQPRELVEPGFPNVLHPPAKGTVPNRLALAQWLVDDRNPLVGRVVMNREWQAFFGRGIVATLEDFGTRGEKPTHPELLDWLATEFTQSGWRMKTIHKLLVMSAAYRQSSRVSPALLERDPGNLLCGRGPRFRCDAEVVRDLALSASGLLTLKVGGPSVRPPQPSEVTSQVYGGGGYSPSTGADRYRRGIYTHLKRGAPFAASITFDAPSADLACLRRARSNTPLQALTLLNDEVFVEAAQAFARRMVSQGGRTLPERIRFLYLCALSRPPTPAESGRIAEFYAQQLARFQSGQAEARSVARGVRPEAANEADIPELAAWTLICRAMLNLDEAITKG